MGQRLNSPNDVAPHRDGSYWFTDPPLRASRCTRARRKSRAARQMPTGRYNSRAGQAIGVGTAKREIMTANVYRVDPQSGRVDMMVSSTNLAGNPNGIAFSPDYKKVYVVNAGNVHSFDLSADNKLSNQKEFSNFMIDGIRCGTDGIRVDVNGNLWCGSNAGRNLGYSGVTVWSPEGKLLGRIRLPETCANLAFGGPKTEPSVHDRGAVALLGLRQHAGSVAGLDRYTIRSRTLLTAWSRPFSSTRWARSRVGTTFSRRLTRLIVCQMRRAVASASAAVSAAYRWKYDEGSWKIVERSFRKRSMCQCSMSDSLAST